MPSFFRCECSAHGRIGTTVTHRGDRGISLTHWVRSSIWSSPSQIPVATAEAKTQGCDGCSPGRARKPLRVRPGVPFTARVEAAGAGDAGQEPGGLEAILGRPGSRFVGRPVRYQGGDLLDQAARFAGATHSRRLSVSAPTAPATALVRTARTSAPTWTGRPRRRPTSAGRRRPTTSSGSSTPDR